MPLVEETPEVFPTAAFALIQQALTSNSSLLAPFGRNTGRVGTKSRTLVSHMHIGCMRSLLGTAMQACTILLVLCGLY